MLAAGAKSYFLSLEAGGDLTQEQGGGLLLALVGFTLGLWLLSGAWRRRAWMASVLWFAACLYWSVTHWLAGAESCGCAGRLSIPPIASAGVVAGLLSGLLIFRPRCDQVGSGHRVRPPASV